MDKKLYRSRDQKMMAGVCGGIAEYFNIDVTLVRLLWAAISIPSFGAGIIIYIIAAIIIPERPFGEQEYVYVNPSGPVDSGKFMSILGVILVIVGVVALMGGMFPAMREVLRHGFWPTIIIVVGVALIYSAWKNQKNN